MSWTFEGFGREVIVPIVVGALVGLGGSWITVNTQIAQLETKVNSHDTDIKALEHAQSQRDKTNQETSERLVRLETKVDLLLRKQGIDASGETPNP